MNTNMNNRCRILRPLVLAILLTVAAISNIALPSQAAPTNPPTPQCLANCNNLLPIIGVAVCPVLCNNTDVNECKNDCKNVGGISVLTCNQICLNLF
jgi:hypothetical protein